jgi:hypothetical protein
MRSSSSAAAVTVRVTRHRRGFPLEPVVAVMFMSGIILAITGSGRVLAIRVGGGVVASDEGGTQPIPLRVRPDVATMLWLAVAIYGLFLAAAAVAVSG